jgi:hypothetical protein
LADAKYWQSSVVMKHEVGHMFALSDNYNVVQPPDQPNAIMSGGSARQADLTESDVRSLNAAFRHNYLGQALRCGNGWFIASAAVSGTTCYPPA